MLRSRRRGLCRLRAHDHGESTVGDGERGLPDPEDGLPDRGTADPRPSGGNGGRGGAVLQPDPAGTHRRAPAPVVDTFARYYIPAVVAIAVLVAAVPPLAMGAPFQPWLYKALVLLVIACPCALVISTPVTVVSGLAAAARHGILIKGGLYLEQGRMLKALALDKTGTIAASDRASAWSNCRRLSGKRYKRRIDNGLEGAGRSPPFGPALLASVGPDRLGSRDRAGDSVQKGVMAVLGSALLFGTSTPWRVRPNCLS